jgi:hypothetical protein
MQQQRSSHTQQQPHSSSSHTAAAAQRTQQQPLTTHASVDKCTPKSSRTHGCTFSGRGGGGGGTACSAAILSTSASRCAPDASLNTKLSVGGHERRGNKSGRRAVSSCTYCELCSTSRGTSCLGCETASNSTAQRSIEHSLADPHPACRMNAVYLTTSSSGTALCRADSDRYFAVLSILGGGGVGKGRVKACKRGPPQPHQRGGAVGSTVAACPLVRFKANAGAGKRAQGATVQGAWRVYVGAVRVGRWWRVRMLVEGQYRRRRSENSRLVLGGASLGSACSRSRGTAGGGRSSGRSRGSVRHSLEISVTNASTSGSLDRYLPRSHTHVRGPSIRKSYVRP